MRRSPSVLRSGLLPGLRPALAGLLLLGCAPEQTPSPTEADIVQQVDRDAQPALYQLLYRPPILPASTELQRRVQVLIWLRHMEFSEPQLAQLVELRSLVKERHAQIVAGERQLLAEQPTDETELYQALWDKLSSGAAADDPEVRALADRLDELGRGSTREQALLQTRVQGIRAIVEALQPFLSTLSPRQEALLGDATFALRHHLDPVGNPSDFRALVGTTYEPGQYAVLTRGLASWGADPLNIGGLWSDEPPLRGGALHQARREVLLYLLLLEPGVDDAIGAARDLLAQDLDLGLEPAADSGSAGDVPEGTPPADAVPPDADPAAPPPAVPPAAAPPPE